MFTKIPIDNTLEIMKTVLNTEKGRLAELRLKSAYFFFNGKLHKQEEGASMSPVAAELFMEDFQKRALDQVNLHIGLDMLTHLLLGHAVKNY